MPAAAGHDANPVSAVPLADSLQERAVNRSLTAARGRARERYERIVDAAYDLIGERDGTDFTLQDVAGRAGVSLRTFYQYFGGREELVLAVFARGVTSSVPILRQATTRHRSPVRQLQAYVAAMFRLVFEDDHPQNRPLTRYHLQLTQTDPEALGAVLAPRNEILLGILQRGIDAGVFRSDIEVSQLAVLVSQALVAIVHTNVLGTQFVGGVIELDALWKFCLGAVSPPGDRRRRVSSPAG